MKPIPFIQFLRPHGEQRHTEIDLEDDCYAKYEQIKAAGARLTAEIFDGGECSFCIEEPELGDYEILIVQNGPKVPVEITKMLRRFDPANFEAWKKASMAEEEV